MSEPQIYTAELVRGVEDTQLFRAVPDETGDGLTIEGHWAVFNAPTIIDSWEGTFREQSAQGAFKRTLNRSKPMMQYDHGSHPYIGSIPIGVWTEAYEDDHGAFSRGRLNGNAMVEPVRDAIASRGLQGMSFRFSVVQDVWHDPTGKQVPFKDVARMIYETNVSESDLLTRTLKIVNVAEAGPVAHPAYVQTAVGVRSKKIVIDLGRLDDPEQRRLLAQATFLAGAAERGSEEGTAQSDPAPDEAPVEPAAEVNDAPPTPDDPSPGEQPSTPTPETDSRDALREALRAQRAYVDTIKKKGLPDGGR